MRRFALALAALALSACGQNEDAAQSASCNLSATSDIAWTQSEAGESVTALASGPSCRQAALLLVVRSAAGDPLWVFASTYDHMTIGAPAPDAPAVTPEQMEAFLTSWAGVTLSQTSALPQWRADAATLNESASVFTYETALARDAYEAVRASDQRMLCYAAGVDSTQCLITDSVTGAPILIAAYGP